MMDLREIIKWFIPCFHILLVFLKLNRNTRLTFVCLFLLFNFCPGYAASSVIQVQTKNVGSFNESYFNVNQSDIISDKNVQWEGSKDVFEGRTFGRPFKKMIAGLLPVVFQLGAASTWAVLAAIVGVKTLAVALFILKLLLLAGAVKLGALFGQKGHHHWEPPHPAHPPQKEIHLHIHNGQTAQHIEEHAAYSGWSRNGVPVTATNNIDTKNINVVYEPYSDGPQTISTPYGNYVKVQSTLPSPIAVKK